MTTDNLKRLNAIKKEVNKYADDNLFNLKDQLVSAYKTNNKRQFDNIEHDIKLYIKESI